MILVFAGDFNQYKNWAINRSILNYWNSNEVMYASKPEMVMSLKRGTKFIKIGTYWEHERWWEFVSWIEAKDFLELNPYTFEPEEK